MIDNLFRTALWAVAIIISFAAPAFVPAARAARLDAAGEQVTFCVATTGDDTKSGIAPDCKKTVCSAIHTAYRDWDFKTTPPKIDVGKGTHEQGECSAGGALVGANYIWIEGHQFTWTSDTNCLSFGDGATFILKDITWVCNQGNHVNMADIYLHQTAILDVFGTHVTSGSGDQHSFIFVDGAATMAIGGSADGSPGSIHIQGRHGYLIRAVQQAMINTGGVWAFEGNTYLDGLFNVMTLTGMKLGMSFSMPGLGYIGSSYASGTAVISTNNIQVPGGITATTNAQICTPGC